MSASQSGKSLVAVVAGVLLPMLAGGGGGLIFAVTSWPNPEGADATAQSYLGLALSGLFVGSTTGLIIGGIMAFHASVLGATRERADAAAIWGLFAGGVTGLSLGPVFGATTGLATGFLAEGAIFGLFFGPLGGILAWQCTFWLTDLRRGADEHQ